MFKRIIILSFLSILLSNSSIHSELVTDNVTAKIIEFGIYELTGHTKIVNSSETAGKSRYVSKVNFLKNTQDVPAILGNRFGFSYITSGLPKNSIAEIKIVYNHPVFKGKAGFIRKGLHNTNDNGSFKAIAGYGFDREFELVPGIWTIEIWSKDNLLVAKSFNIIQTIQSVAKPDQSTLAFVSYVDVLLHTQTSLSGSVSTNFPLFRSICDKDGYKYE